MGTETLQRLEWRKTQKALYLPKNMPSEVVVPPMNYYVVSGKGNPNNPEFGSYIQVLYALSYAIRMSYKGGNAPEGFMAYTVFPLEGVWDVGDKAQYEQHGFDKDNLVFDMMIRQPDFVSADYALNTIEKLKLEKPMAHLDEVRFETMDDGLCVHMMHIGPYDAEAASFERMEAYCEENRLKRSERVHREIYISDPGRTAPEKMRTVLRFKAEKV